MNWWREAHRWSPLGRWAGKILLLMAIVTLVLFPKPWLLATLLNRLQRLDTLIQPELAEVGKLANEVRAGMPAELPPRMALQVTESVVRQRIPYSSDWDTWGVMEYIPSAAEALQTGREDCDGRAVVAASVLRRLGYQAWLVTDQVHMWVETPIGETMGPGGKKTLSVGKPGTTGVQFAGWPTRLANSARGFSYGVAVFPLPRELLIWLAMALLTVHPWGSGWRQFAGALVMLIGLLVLREVGAAAAQYQSTRELIFAAGGAIVIVGGWLVMALRGPRAVPIARKPAEKEPIAIHADVAASVAPPFRQ